MKERIRSKADELFQRYGIKSVTMDEIASHLGISKKTIYQYYADKEEIVEEVFAEHMTFSKQQCANSRETAENAIHEVFLAMECTGEMLQQMNPAVIYDLERYHPEVFQKFKKYKHEFLFKVIAANIRRGMDEELYRADLNVELTARTRIGTIMMSCDPELFPAGKYNVREVETEIIMQFLHALATPKGIRYINRYSQQQLKKLTV